jgi:hypothetical protein
MSVQTVVRVLPESTVPIGWLGWSVLDTGQSLLAPRMSSAARSTDCLALRRPIFNILPLSRMLANGSWRFCAPRWLARRQVPQRLTNG